MNWHLSAEINKASDVDALTIGDDAGEAKAAQLETAKKAVKAVLGSVPGPGPASIQLSGTVVPDNQYGGSILIGVNRTPKII